MWQSHYIDSFGVDNIEYKICELYMHAFNMKYYSSMLLASWYMEFIYYTIFFFFFLFVIFLSIILFTFSIFEGKKSHTKQHTILGWILQYVFCISMCFSFFYFYFCLFTTSYKSIDSQIYHSLTSRSHCHFNISNE